MISDFKIIAITSPSSYPNEAEIINSLLKRDDITFLHIRKPDYQQFEIEMLLKQIDSNFHSKLKLHDHFQLLEKYSLAGVHLNNRNREAPLGAKSISKSFHLLSELKDLEIFDYFFISPVFDSISKNGYKAAFDLKELEIAIKNKKAVALGGVTPEKIPVLKKMGFWGGAMLGYFFPERK